MKGDRIWQRGEVYYYRTRSMTKWKSTGCTLKKDALDYIEAHRNDIPKPKKVKPGTTLRQLLEPYYIWDRCPHVQRLRDENKSVTQEHVKACRALIDKKILTDPIADRAVSDLKRADFIDLRSRLLKGNGTRTVNRAMAVLKTCLKEEYFRENLARDPTQGVGQIKYEKRESGIFTKAELQTLFPREGLGHWRDIEVYTAFLILATCGLRRGELLGLRWKSVDLTQRVLQIQEALRQDNKTLGLPKWRKVRTVPLPEIVAARLLELRKATLSGLPDTFVFHREDGGPKRVAWIGWHFAKVMQAMKIDPKARGYGFTHSGIVSI